MKNVRKPIKSIMKKICLIITMTFSVFFAVAQHVPQGMKYQAVARNLSGAILANQEVALKINLVTQNGNQAVIYYSEVHTVITNQLGLFSLTIGEGKIETGSFSKIPWSTEDVWMQVAIKDKGKSIFETISNSKLLAVPYAFHAETATKLAGATNNEGASVTSPTMLTTSLSTSVPAAVWALKGNISSNPLYDRLGTGDSVDLIIETNNTERLRIFANGDIGVKQNVHLNTAGGNTDIKGITTIINNTPSTNIITGALVVNGGVGIGGNLNVGGGSNFGSVGTNNLSAKSINITDDNPSFLVTINNTNVTDGDGLKIKLGRVHPLWNGTAYEKVASDDFSPVYHAFSPQIALVGSWLSTGNVSVSASDVLSLLKSTGTFLGGALCQLTNALSPLLNQKIGLPVDISTPINNGIGLPFDLTTPINRGLNLPIVLGPYVVPAVIMPAVKLPQINDPITDSKIIGEITLFPQTTLLPAITIFPQTTVIPLFPALTIPALPAFSIPAIPQISCDGLPQVGAPTILTSNVNNSLTNKNEFIKFVDKDDRTLGVIRAQSIGDFKNYYLSSDYLFHLVSVVGGIDIAKGLLSLASEFNKLAHSYNNMGVEYVSGNGDYAEWMQRESLSETITAGDIVGVIGGKISKNLAGAEQIMAVSTQPIVSANMPNAAKVNLGNSIAFMGQIPVKIIGSVTTGDFIIAKGNVPGYGVAVNPLLMTTEDFRLIVGRAWETINADGPKLVNTLVGVQNNDFLKIIQKYQQQVINAETRVSTAEERLNTIERKLKIYPLSTKISHKK